MSKHTTLNAKKRERSGKGAARAIRREKFIPAVIYGDKQTPIMISMEEKVIVKEIHTPGFRARLFDIAVEGGDKYLSLCQAVQFDPVSDRPVHADFLRVSATSEVIVPVALIFKNELLSPGIKMGGVLNVIERTVEIACRPDSIPEHFEIDLAGFEIGDVVHAKDLKLPAGARLEIDEGETLATITPPTLEKADEASAAGDAAAAAAPAAGGDKAAASKAAAAPKAAAKPEAKK